MEKILTYEVLIGETVRDLRIRKGYSIEDIAARANLSPTSVRSLELGRGSSLSTLLKVFNELGEIDLFTEWHHGSKEFSPLMALKESRKQNPRPRRVSSKARKERVKYNGF